MGSTCICGSRFTNPKKQQYRNKAEMKASKKTTLLSNNGEKERQEDYPTSVVYFCKCTCSVVFLSFFFAIVPYM